MSRRNRRIDNFPPNYSSFGPLQSYLLHARGWKPILESAATLKHGLWNFRLQFTHTYYRYSLLSFESISSPFIKYIYIFYSQFLRSPRRLFHVFERKKYRFPFFSFFTIRAQHNSNNEVRILDGFLYVNLIRLSFLVSYPPPLFIPKYLPIPHFYLYNISRNLFPQKLSKNLF